MDECTDALEEARILSILDANSGYRLVKIDKRDREKVAVTSHHGL